MKADQICQMLRGPINKENKDGSHTLMFQPLDGLSSDSTMKRSVMTYSDARLTLEALLSGFTALQQGGVMVALATT